MRKGSTVFFTVICLGVMIILYLSIIPFIANANQSEDLQNMANRLELLQKRQEAMDRTIQILLGQSNKGSQPEVRKETLNIQKNEGYKENIETSLNINISPIIVGGTDGSGTRSVVDLLERLGVLMLVDDRGTNDIHGEEMGGWPPVVRPVLEATHSSNYEVDKLPAAVTHTTRQALQKLINSKSRQASKMRDHKHTAKGVSWGFKAPVSMILIPFFYDIFGSLKFLHVVRDGRDIAFSGNQSPVNKFYNNMYPGKWDRWNHLPQVRGIELWSDWNSALLDWERKQRPNFDFLVLRTEDLVDPSTKFAAARQVARFVGSDFTDDEICCLVNEPAKFMGGHDKSKNDRQPKLDGQQKLLSRYGHWEAKVEGNPQLNQTLHQIGARGLQLFGYHPRRIAVQSLDYECVLTEEQCRAVQAETIQKKNTKVTKLTDAEKQAINCKFEENADYFGGDLLSTKTDSLQSCCYECSVSQQCKFFTFSPKIIFVF